MDNHLFELLNQLLHDIFDDAHLDLSLEVLECIFNEAFVMLGFSAVDDTSGLHIRIHLQLIIVDDNGGVTRCP